MRMRSAIPRQGDFIYVLWTESNTVDEVVNQPFKAFVLGASPTLTSSNPVIATGTIQYLQTKDYDSSTHVVSFLSARRIQSTFQ